MAFALANRFCIFSRFPSGVWALFVTLLLVRPAQGRLGLPAEDAAYTAPEPAEADAGTEPADLAPSRGTDPPVGTDGVGVPSGPSASTGSPTGPGGTGPILKKKKKKAKKKVLLIRSYDYFQYGSNQRAARFRHRSYPFSTLVEATCERVY